MSFTIAIQNAQDFSQVPASSTLQRWATCVLKNRVDTAEVCIRIVDETESASLNKTYRDKHYPTNVLSFPYEPIKGIVQPQPYLGDLVLCSSVIEREAIQQQKSTEAHWAHMVVHGILHLLGYDHVVEIDAQEMEALEIKILSKLGYSNPYGDDTV